MTYRTKVSVTIRSGSKNETRQIVLKVYFAPKLGQLRPKSEDAPEKAVHDQDIAPDQTIVDYKAQEEDAEIDSKGEESNPKQP